MRGNHLSRCYAMRWLQCIVYQPTQMNKLRALLPRSLFNAATLVVTRILLQKTPQMLRVFSTTAMLPPVLVRVRGDPVLVALVILGVELAAASNVRLDACGLAGIRASIVVAFLLPVERRALLGLGLFVFEPVLDARVLLVL